MLFKKVLFVWRSSDKALAGLTVTVLSAVAKCGAAVYLALMLSACATPKLADKSVEPAWILGESSDYPRSKYLLGVGEADSLTLAKSRARAEIAKIFTIEVQSHMRDVSKFSRVEDASAANSASSNSLPQSQQNSQDVQRDISSQSSQLMRGLELPLAWKDEESQRYYALAVLPRLQGALSLRQQIDSLDSETQTVLQRAQSSNSLIAKIRLSAQAISAQKTREQLNRQLQVISIDGSGVDSQWSVLTLKNDRAALLARISVRAVARGDKAEQLTRDLRDALANDGFNVSQTGEYTVTAVLETIVSEPSREWAQRNATLSISIMGEGQSNIGGHHWDLRVRSTQSELVDQRLMEKVRVILNSELEDRLFDILDGES